MCYCILLFQSKLKDLWSFFSGVYLFIYLLFCLVAFCFAFFSQSNYAAMNEETSCLHGRLLSGEDRKTLEYISSPPVYKI